jgi:hypothetical protein
VTGAVLVGGAAISGVVTLSTLTFLRGRMSSAEFLARLVALRASGLGARPLPPATVPAGANPYRPEIADLVPAYLGSKTTGVLDLNGRVVAPQDSGYSGPVQQLSPPRRGMNGTNMSHVEAHAAAQMRISGTMNATLYINRTPCPGRNGCARLLPRMLPPGSSLTVYGPEGYAEVFYGDPG